MKQLSNKRRDFMKTISLSLGALALAPDAFSSLSSQTQVWSPGGRQSASGGKKLGIALVGLGTYSRDQLGPSLLQTEHCYLAGIVTGTPEKAEVWSEKYGIPQKNIYNYHNFDEIAGNPDIDIVYVVLPVFMHKEFTIRAAKAGKHVICEKPMAMNSAECVEMIDACRNANRLLSIGYRLHFEPYNIEMMLLGQKKILGNLTSVEAENGFKLLDPNVWRLKKNLAGGGALMDAGVYAIQGARYTTGMEPIAVTAKEEKTRPDIFSEVDETIRFKLEFPGGLIADCRTSFNMDLNKLRATAAGGWFEIAPAYSYSGQKGKTSGGPMNFKQVKQQALQMDDFARCVLTNEKSRVPGEEGLRDMRVIDAIYRSVKTGRRELVGK